MHQSHSFLTSLKTSQSIQKIYKNIGWLFFNQVFRTSISLVVGSWLARYLGPSNYGMYNYALSIAAIIAPFSTLGIDSVVVREVTVYPEQQENIISTATISKLFAGLLTVTGLFLWLIYFQPYNKTLRSLILIAGISALIRPLDAIDFYFQAITSSKFTIYAKSTAFLCANSIKVFLLRARASIQGLIATDIIDSLISGFCLYALYRKQGHRLKLSRFRKEILYRLLNDSWPLIISSSLVMVYMRIDQIMIGNLIGNQETGIYAVAVKIAELSYFLPMAIVSSVFPRIIEKKTQSEKNFTEGMQTLYRSLSVISYITSLTFTLLSGTIVSKIYGPNYIDARSALIVLTWSCMWVSLGVARSSFLTAINKNILHLKSIAIATAINIVLNFILIPRFGILGAGIATNLSYSFAAYFSCFLYKELRETGSMMTKSILLLRG